MRITKDVPHTINAAELAKLPEAIIPDSYHLSQNEGSGCAMDPPGYPTYFIRHVYTADYYHEPTGG